MSQKKSGVPKLPSALEDRRLESRLANSKIALFLDYDGTLTPIVNDPSQAVLSQQSREVLEKLATLCPVIILSGRDVQDVRTMVGLENIIYAGSHGFDVVDRRGEKLANTNWDRFLPTLDAVEENLRHESKSLPGVLVERKKFAVAVHYRKVSSSNLVILKRRFNQVAARFPSLKKTKGKKIFELIPDVDWNKGTALISLIDTLGLKSKGLPIFIGDDITDEDAFRMIKDKGVGILVGKAKLGTRACYSLRNHIEARIFLERLIRILKTSRNSERIFIRLGYRINKSVV